MQSYTYMSNEAVGALKRALAIAVHEPAGFKIEPNENDMKMLVAALAVAYETGAENGMPEVAEWAGEFLSSMAQQVDIEFV